MCPRIIFPFVHWYIHKFIRNTFEKQFCIEQIRSTNRHRRVYSIFSRSKLSYLAHKFLFCESFIFFITESLSITGECSCRTYLLAQHYIISLHKTVTGCKNRQDIIIKLIAEQYYEQTEYICKKKSGKLKYANMLTE